MRAYYFLFILLVAIIPLASAEVKTIGIGNDVFIGELGIDITDCVGNAQQLAWFEAVSTPAIDVPNYVKSVGDATNFYVAPADFVERTGNWYQWTGTGGATIVAFNVLDPSLDAKVWDQKTAKDVSGKSVPAGDRLNFRIESNLYTIAQRPNYNPATDGQFTIKVKTADGFVYNALFQTTSVSISLLKVSVSQQPAYWVNPNNDNTIGWNTGVLDSQGARMYKAGVYTVTAECNVNGIKDNYKAPDGSNYIGKTVSSTRTVTITTYTFQPPDIIAPGDIIPVTVPRIVPVQPDIIAPGDIIPVTVPDIVPVQPHIIAPGDIIPVTVPDIAPPSMPGMEWPSGYGKFESSDNARGIYYNGKLYVWSIWWSSSAMPWNENFYRIQVRTFSNGQLSGASQLWDGESYAEPAPVIVQYPNNGPEKMFVFVTGKNGNIYFTRLNGTVWEDGDWLKIADSATGQSITTEQEGWEVAPVYNPSNHRLYLYYAKDYNDYLYVVYSDDYGNTWYNPGKVVNSPIVKSPPGAVLYHDPSNNDILLAVKDSEQKIRICHMGLNFVTSSEVLPTPTSDNINGYGRPFLTDVGNGYIALMYAAEHGDQTYCPDWYVPHICLFNKTTGQWGEPYQAASLPDLGVAQGEYEFHWQPNGAMDPTSNTFWLFYGFELCALYTDDTNNGPWWMFNPIKTPGT